VRWCSVAVRTDTLSPRGGDGICSASTSRTAAASASSVEPGRILQSNVTTTLSGITLRLWGSTSTMVAVTEAFPRTGSVGWRSARTPTAASTLPRASRALWARSGALACPAVPVMTTSSSARPRWPMHTSPWVDSPMITTPGFTTPDLSRCFIPSPPRSSMTVCATTTSPGARPMRAAAT